MESCLSALNAAAYCKHLQVLKFMLNSLLLLFPFSRISLEVMTLNPICESVETAEGVAITVTGVAQVSSLL